MHWMKCICGAANYSIIVTDFFVRYFIYIVQAIQRLEISLGDFFFLLPNQLRYESVFFSSLVACL